MNSIELENSNSVTFIAFDTETTGSFPISESMVEIGAVKFAPDGEVLDEFCELIDPGSPIPANVMRVHGIRNRDVRGKDPIELVLPRFIDFIGDSILIAHNAPFDIAFIGVQMIIQSIPFPTNEIFDSVQMCQIFLPEVRQINLRSMAKRLGMKGIKCHRAFNDALVVRELFLNITKNGDDQVDLQKLHENCTINSFADARKIFSVQMPRHLNHFKENLKNNGPINIEYTTRGKESKVWQVVPHTLFQHNRNAYMMAFCRDSGSMRNFRLDRIKQILPE